MIAYAFALREPKICSSYTDITFPIVSLFVLYLLWFLPLYFLRTKGILSVLGWLLIGGMMSQVLLLIVMSGCEKGCQNGEYYNIFLNIKSSVEYVLGFYNEYIVPVLILTIIFVLFVKICTKNFYVF